MQCGKRWSFSYHIHLRQKIQGVFASTTIWVIVSSMTQSTSRHHRAAKMGIILVLADKF